MGGDLMDAVSLKLARNYTNEKLNSLPSNAPTKTVTFDGGIYSVGSDVVNGQVSVVAKGRTWQQLFPIWEDKDTNNIPDNYTLGGSASSTKSMINGIFNVTLTSDGSFILYKDIKLINGHKYYISGDVLSSNKDINVYVHNDIGTYRLVDKCNIIGCIITAESNVTRITIGNITSSPTPAYSTGDMLSLKNMYLYDLTEIFGAGSEPTTAEQASRIFHYVSGTKSTNSVRIRSVNEDETKESIAYVNLPPGEVLRSLPNGTKDEVNVVDGKRTQKIKEYVLQADDIISISQTGTYVDLITIRAFSDISTVQTWVQAYSELITDRTTGRTTASWDLETSYWTHSYDSSKKIYIYIPKGTYANLTETRSALAGTTLIYQLATPIVTKLPAQAPLQVFENGTVYVEPLGDPSETTLPTVELTVPIASGNKVGIATHDYAGAAADWVLTNNESKCKSLLVTNAGGAANIIAPDKPGLTFTINNKSGQAITIKKSGGTGVTITNGKKVTVQHFGTDYEAISPEI